MSWLAGGGEMGALIRSMDWSKTPLGPLESWPQSLRTSVSLCLSSTFPILVAWGPDDIQIYNDAYRPICGDLHPRAMGGAFREVWASALPVVGDAFERAHHGEGVYIRDQRMFLDRVGYLEEAFMTFSFSPIRDETGAVGGIFHPISEATSAVLNARRTRVLRDLNAAISDARAIGDIAHDIEAQYQGMALDLPFVLLYQLDAHSGKLLLRGAAGTAGHDHLAPAIVAADDAIWPFASAARTRAPQQVHGLRERFADGPCGPYETAPDAALVLPVTVPGQAELYGFVVAGVSAARALDEDYLHFYELLGATVNTAAGNVVAYEKEQRRAEELAQIDRAKTAFFSNVSHEFRTPLTLILGPLADALADGRDPLPPAQRQRIDVTHRNALRLLKLVNSLLDFSRIEAGRALATYAPLDLARLTTDLAGVFESAMEKGGLQYHLDIEDLGQPVYVDRDMWEKIVFNLLSNAFKFTLQGAVIVSLYRHAGMARLSVRDTGSGIPAAELPRVFERFHRIEGTPGRTYEGTGIGLALIQELVRLHGGAIAVHSEPDNGTRFDVDIPFGHAHLPEERVDHRGEDAADDVSVSGDDARRMGAASFVEEALRWLPDEPEPPRPIASFTGTGAPAHPAAPLPRILVADDNNDMRAYLKALLECHAEVTVCADGEAAFALALRDRPDLLLSDVMMPRLDGFGLLARIRASEALRHLPVILLSARAGQEAKVEGLQAGADDYLVKPFAAGELLARVQRQLDLARERRERHAEMAQRETYFRSLVDMAPVMLWTTDPGGQCTYLSRRWYEYTGRSPGQDLGMGWLDNVHPDDFAHARDIFVAANAEHVPFSFDYRLRRHDGTYRWFIDAGMPRFDEAGVPNGFVGTVVDIDARTHAERELQRLADELTATNRMQSEFLVTLAHELRNPLAPIRTGLELMRAAPAGMDTGRVQAMMRRQVTHMVRLVDDLLDMARLSEGKVELRREPVPLDRLVRDALEISAPLVDAGRHRLTVDLPPATVTLHVDRHRIAQVLSNLVNNAAKYTPPGGHIEVAARIKGADIAIAVTDSGIGIDAAMLAAVFDMYAQVKQHHELAQGGLGVGLNLVKRLVELHGGRVSVHSDGAGQGSRFTITLPLGDSGVAALAAESAAAGDPAAPEGEGGALRVLVVDDNVDAAQMLAALVEMRGHAVRMAHTGKDALAIAARERPHIVLLDIGLPDRTGYEVAPDLRRLDGMAGAILVALTGWGTDKDRQRSRDAGLDAHLTKPVDLARIDALLLEAAARRGGEAAS
ncbi:response regulator [Pseudoduganella umbonata]|uniref:histidine kinase n=1 Tax=Pseudoduganella umbonata TaxID=864828 RepID=A0ABX5UT94_9BURK|nr:response regulator [Pseudoduganella umbonata]